MKKFLAILLAMMLVMVSVVAMASTVEPGNLEPYVDENDPSVPGTYTGGSEDNTETATGVMEVPFSKSVNVLSYNSTGVTPEQNLKFTVSAGTVTGNDSVTTAPTVTIVGVKQEGEETAPPVVHLDAGATTADMTIILPSYSAVGIYTYQVTESNLNDTDATPIAGITYGSFELKVTVVRNVTTKKLYVGGIAIRQEDKKTDEIENEFASGSLTVKKLVEGNLGDRAKKFPIKVKFTSAGKTVASTISYTVPGATEPLTIEPSAWSNGEAQVTVNLANTETAVFNNIPYDVTYTVLEDASISRAATDVSDPTKTDAYSVSGEVTAQAITAADMKSVTITNTKNITPDTGITLETLPYVLMMALTMMGFVALKLRKREEY